METTIILPPDYHPSADEEYMNELQQEYFRQKLLNWKKSLISQSQDTLDGLVVQGGLNQPDQNDRASLEADKALELRTRDRARFRSSRAQATVSSGSPKITKPAMERESFRGQMGRSRSSPATVMW